MAITNVAAYKFTELTDLAGRRRRLRRECQQLDLRGTILLADEGVNLFVAGPEAAIRQLIVTLEADPEIGPLCVKMSETGYQPFNRMLVKVKKEIIAFGVEGISPARHTSAKIAPRELKQWLDEGRELTLLDTRNDYEIGLGTFEGATTLGIDHFRDFPQAVEQLPQDLQGRPLVMFCTGGIRCEKAGPLMERLGFEHVFQLDGGILNYFEQVGGQHYRGDCFVFDQRVAVDAALRETDAAQCYACQAILSPEDQSSPYYVKPDSCPYCYKPTEAAMQESIARRHKQIEVAVNPLPGSIAYDHYRPIHVAGEFDGWELSRFLPAAVQSVDRVRWMQEIEQGRILLRGTSVRLSQRVAAGEKYEHLHTNVTEPEVNAEIQILYEDSDLVVVNKPAPLPMHEGGRYNRNTLKSILETVYAPERLRHAHRLDANTTGVVLFSRTRRIAKRLQAQFEATESGTRAEKTYLARVAGHPVDDRFVCEAAIAKNSSPSGVRLLNAQGAAARTEFEVLRRLDDRSSLVIARPITGRTNQIRLHLWSLGIPVVGDPSYFQDGQTSRRQALTPGEPPMCLHAWRIEIAHPSSGERVEYEAPLPTWAEESVPESLLGITD